MENNTDTKRRQAGSTPRQDTGKMCILTKLLFSLTQCLMPLSLCRSARATNFWTAMYSILLLSFIGMISPCRMLSRDYSNASTCSVGKEVRIFRDNGVVIVVTITLYVLGNHCFWIIWLLINKHLVNRANSIALLHLYLLNSTVILSRLSLWLIAAHSLWVKHS